MLIDPFFGADHPYEAAVDENNVKTVVEYTTNDDGRKVKAGFDLHTVNELLNTLS
jgi:hypothetical protein